MHLLSHILLFFIAAFILLKFALPKLGEILMKKNMHENGMDWTQKEKQFIIDCYKWGIISIAWIIFLIEEFFLSNFGFLNILGIWLFVTGGVLLVFKKLYMKWYENYKDIIETDNDTLNDD